MEQKAQQFILDLELIDRQKYDIVSKLFQLYCEFPQLTDHFIYGGIGMYIGNDLIGGIYVSKHHVSLVFSRGNELIDKFNVLEGSGKFRRHIVLTSIDNIMNKQCAYYIRENIELYSPV
jgi:hypothetical protein